MGGGSCKFVYERLWREHLSKCTMINMINVKIMKSLINAHACFPTKTQSILIVMCYVIRRRCLSTSCFRHERLHIFTVTYLALFHQNRPFNITLYLLIGLRLRFKPVIHGRIWKNCPQFCLTCK